MREKEYSHSCGLCGKGFADLRNAMGNIRQHFVSCHIGLHGIRGRRKNGVYEYDKRIGDKESVERRI